MQLIGNDKAAGRLDATFAALADPTRRAILARLRHGEASVTELAAPFEELQAQPPTRPPATSPPRPRARRPRRA